MEDIVKAKVARYLMLREDIAELKKDMEDVKKELDPYLSEGRENAKGSRVLDFTEPLTVSGKVYPGVQKTRKVKKSLNEDRVLEFLRARAVELGPQGAITDTRYLEPIVTVEHVDFDALWDLHVRDLITEEELDSFFDEDVTWAFTPISE